MSDMDPFAGRKEAGKKKWAGKAVEKEARTRAQMDTAAAERAAADAAAKERAREARQARSRMDTEEHRRRQAEFREQTKKMHETPGGATSSIWRYSVSVRSRTTSLTSVALTNA
jgi:hypothetical protein